MPLDKEICHKCCSKRWRYLPEKYEPGWQQEWNVVGLVACHPKCWPDGEPAKAVKVSAEIPRWCDYYLEQIVSARTP